MTAKSFTIIENCADYADEIAAATEAAFRQRYGSGAGEATLIAALRAAGDVIVELAALEEGEVVGHAMFSRMTADPPTRNFAALGPVSARIDRQGFGIGTALIRVGLERCLASGIDAVALLGDPTYYQRFGFSVDLGKALNCTYSGPHFQAIELRPGALSGGPWNVAYAPAFSVVD